MTSHNSDNLTAFKFPELLNGIREPKTKMFILRPPPPPKKHTENLRWPSTVAFKGSFTRAMLNMYM